MLDAVQVPGVIFKDLREKFKIPQGTLESQDPKFPIFRGTFPALRFAQDDGCIIFLQTGCRVSRLVVMAPKDNGIRRSQDQRGQVLGMVVSGGFFYQTPDDIHSDEGVRFQSAVRVMPALNFSLGKSTLPQLFGYLITRSAQIVDEVQVRSVVLTKGDLIARGCTDHDWSDMKISGYEV